MFWEREEEGTEGSGDEMMEEFRAKRGEGETCGEARAISPWNLIYSDNITGELDAIGTRVWAMEGNGREGERENIPGKTCHEGKIKGKKEEILRNGGTSDKRYTMTQQI